MNENDKQAEPVAWESALEFAAQTIELYDDATMRNDYMLDASECAAIIRALKTMYPTQPVQPVEPVAADHSGLIKRIDAALERVTQGRGLMSIPADPRSDVDLVLSECKELLKGEKPPFWAKDFYPAPAVAVNDDLAKAVHYPDCWDVAAYPTLADALRELATCFQCCECVKNPAVAVNEQMLALLKTIDNEFDNFGDPSGIEYKFGLKAAIAAAEQMKWGV